MEESEKLMALKKAYAEIILNTTKEAAVRIMESERKAVRAQQELFSVKEESLHMLMRLKQTLDAKNNEVEIVSISQNKKIEELEAQLHEAEDIVKELREELREVQVELERVKTTQSQPELREEFVAVSNAKILSSDGTYKASDDCSKDISCKAYCYFPSPAFPSIMKRCKEPKLHRNGCTQRIRACEGNSGKEVPKETARSENEKGDQSCDIMEPSYSNGSKMVRLENSSGFEVTRSIRRKRKRATRYSKEKAPSLMGPVSHAEETQNLSCSKNSQDEEATRHIKEKASCLDLVEPAQEVRIHLCSENSEDEYKRLVQLSIASVEQPGDKDKGFVESQGNRAIRNPPDKGSADRTSCMKHQDLDEETQIPSCSKDSLCEGKAYVQSEVATFEQWSDKDKGFLESQVERESNEPEVVPGLAADSEKLEGSSLNLDMKTLDHEDGVPNQSPDSKFLKYTFQRKRKREVSCSPDPNSCVKENNAKKNMVQKCSGSLEPKSLSFTTESSPDSRRLVQVAHQLISLSGKKGWK